MTANSRISSLAPRISPRTPLLIILLLFTALTLYNSATLPIGEAADETDHYQYHRFVARTGHPPLTAEERKEAGFKGGLAPLYYWLTAWPIALIGDETLPDIRRVDSRPERHIPTDGLGINHVLHTLDEQWPWQGQILAWHLVRLLSLPMAWVTLIVIYALARRLRPQSKSVALVAVTFAAFLPRFAISSAVINDDNLVFALIALLLLTQVVILQGKTRPAMFAILGTLFGLALITKYFALILAPEILFTLFVYWFMSKKTSRKTLPSFIAFLLTFTLTAGLWFGLIAIRFNRIDELGLIPGLAAALGEPQITEGLAGLFSGQAVRPPAATYSLWEWLSLLYRSFWFEYGWMNIFAPAWVYVLYGLFSTLTLFGLIQKIMIYSLRKTFYALRSNPIAVLLALHLALFVIVVLARYILSATIDTGQGRHLYPALPAIAFLAGVGLTSLRFPKIKHSYAPILTGYSLLSTLILIPTIFILPNYQTIPVTIAPHPSSTDIFAITDEFTLRGLDTKSIVSAGDTLPVTLYWQIDREVNQDYLVSLCLTNNQNQPAGCWRGHFVNGHYPARAWEAGDILADTIDLPIPICYRLGDQSYHLELELWPLKPDTPQPTLADRPIYTHTFTEPTISIRPANSLKTLPQNTEVWLGDQRLTEPTTLGLNQGLTSITYAHGNNSFPTFTHANQNQTWAPLAQFNTNLYLPCDDGPSPFAQTAHFIVDPTLPSGEYQTQTNTIPPITLALRNRNLSPLTTTLTFNHTLAPLSLQLLEQPPIGFNLPATNPSLPFILPPSSLILPITIPWQSHRYMSDPLVISLKLLDKDFNIGGEYVGGLGDRYPNVLWVPTEIVEETYPIPIKPNAPPGLYQLEFSLIHQDQNLPSSYEYLPVFNNDTKLGTNLYPATIRLLDPAHGTPPSNPFSAQLGDSIKLTGYDPPPSPISNPQSPILLTLYWQSIDTIPTDYTVFTQLIGPDGQVWAQWDNPPQAGRLPTTAWAKNDTVVDRYTLTLREGAPAGEYRLLVGMYDPTTGERLPAAINGEVQPDNAIQLTVLSLNP